MQVKNHLTGWDVGNISSGTIDSARLPEATSSAIGGVKKNRWQKKFLFADVTQPYSDLSTSPSNSDFKFTNLEIGKHYELVLHVRASAFEVIAWQDATTTLVTRVGPSALGNDNVGGVSTFKATSTFIRFQAVELTSGGILSGNNATETYAILIERNDLEDEVSIW